MPPRPENAQRVDGAAARAAPAPQAETLRPPAQAATVGIDGPQATGLGAASSVDDPTTNTHTVSTGFGELPLSGRQPIPLPPPRVDSAQARIAPPAPQRVVHAPAPTRLDTRQPALPVAPSTHTPREHAATVPLPTSADTQPHAAPPTEALNTPASPQTLKEGQPVVVAQTADDGGDQRDASSHQQHRQGTTADAPAQTQTGGGMGGRGEGRTPAAAAADLPDPHHLPKHHGQPDDQTSTAAPPPENNVARELPIAVGSIEPTWPLILDTARAAIDKALGNMEGNKPIPVIDFLTTSMSTVFTGGSAEASPFLHSVVRIGGNVDLEQSTIVFLGEDHEDAYNHLAIGAFLDKHARPDDVILVEGILKGKEVPRDSWVKMKYPNIPSGVVIKGWSDASLEEPTQAAKEKAAQAKYLADVAELIENPDAAQLRQKADSAVAQFIDLALFQRNGPLMDAIKEEESHKEVKRVYVIGGRGHYTDDPQFQKFLDTRPYAAYIATTPENIRQSMEHASNDSARRTIDYIWPTASVDHYEQVLADPRISKLKLHYERVEGGTDVYYIDAEGKAIPIPKGRARMVIQGKNPVEIGAFWRVATERFKQRSINDLMEEMLSRAAAQDLPNREPSLITIDEGMILLGRPTNSPQKEGRELSVTTTHESPTGGAEGTHTNQSERLKELLRERRLLSHERATLFDLGPTDLGKYAAVLTSLLHDETTSAIDISDAIGEIRGIIWYIAEEKMVYSEAEKNPAENSSPEEEGIWGSTWSLETVTSVDATQRDKGKKFFYEGLHKDAPIYYADLLDAMAYTSDLLDIDDPQLHESLKLIQNALLERLGQHTERLERGDLITSLGEVTAGGIKSKLLKQQLRAKRIKIWNDAEAMMKHSDFSLPDKPTTLELVRINAADLATRQGSQNIRDIIKYARQYGLEPCPAWVGPVYILHNDTPHDMFLTPAMEPINLSADGLHSPHRFSLSRRELATLGGDTIDMVEELIFVRPKKPKRNETQSSQPK